MYRWIVLVVMLLACALAPHVAFAQSQKGWVVIRCSTPNRTYAQNDEQPVEVDRAGNVCVQFAVGTYADGSKALSTTAADVFAAPAAGVTRVRLVLLNSDFVTGTGGGGVYCWCRYDTAAHGAAAAHGVGSFLIPPGGGMDIAGPGVPQTALNCVAESGTPVLYAEQE